MNYLQGIVMGVVNNFETLTLWQQTIFFAYIASGIFCPFYTYKQAIRFKKGTSGIGDTCIRSLINQTTWRLPALLYSVVCFKYLALPMFISTALDITARSLVIRAAIKSHQRAVQGSEENNDFVYDMTDDTIGSDSEIALETN